jgi:hypothetical protein
MLGSVLQNLRTVYDKNGKKMVSAEGGSNIEDPATFFANVFGGERFMDYVRGVCVWGTRVPPSSSRTRS